MVTKKLAQRLSADWITIIFFRWHGSRLGRCLHRLTFIMQDMQKYQMKPWLLYLWSLSIFTCTFTPLHIALFGHCWFTCDHCLGDLNARSCCLTIPGLLSLDTCNVMSYVICHTYLKLVQMISWSRCVSACDCVMTGCCNILSPFISRRISDTSHRSGPLSARARPGVAGPRAVVQVWTSPSSVHPIHDFSADPLINCPFPLRVNRKNISDVLWGEHHVQ